MEACFQFISALLEYTGEKGEQEKAKSYSNEANLKIKQQPLIHL